MKLTLNRGLLLEKAANESTISHLRENVAAHKTHVEVLERRLDEVQCHMKLKCEILRLLCLILSPELLVLSTYRTMSYMFQTIQRFEIWKMYCSLSKGRRRRWAWNFRIWKRNVRALFKSPFILFLAAIFQYYVLRKSFYNETPSKLWITETWVSHMKLLILPICRQLGVSSAFSVRSVRVWLFNFSQLLELDKCKLKVLECINFVYIKEMLGSY